MYCPLNLPSWNSYALTTGDSETTPTIRVGPSFWLADKWVDYCLIGGNMTEFGIYAKL